MRRGIALTKLDKEKAPVGGTISFPERGERRKYLRCYHACSFFLEAV